MENKLNNPQSLNLKNRLKFLAKDTLLYGAAAMISKAFGLITFPILTRFFSISDYGVINFFVSFSALLAVIFMFGQESAVARYFYEVEEDEEKRQVISQSIVIQVISIIILTPIFWWFSQEISSFLYSSSDVSEIFVLVLFQMPFLVFINYSSVILKWTFKRTAYLIMTLGGTFLNLILIVSAVLVFKVGVEGIFLVILVNNIILCIYGLLSVRKWLTVPKGFYYWKRLISYAAPMGLTGLLTTFVPTFERSLVERNIGADELGLYGAGATVAALILLIEKGFQTAWGPFSLSIYKAEDSDKTYNVVGKIFSVLIFVSALIISLVSSPLITFLASSKYAGAVVVVFPLVFAYSLRSILGLLGLGIVLSKKTYLRLYGKLTMTAVTIVCIALLTEDFGLRGVAYGVLIGSFVTLIFESYLAFRAYYISWPYKDILILGFITFVFGIAASVFGVESYLMYSILHVVGVIVIIVLSYFVLLNKNERGKIKELTSKRLIKRKN